MNYLNTPLELQQLGSQSAFAFSSTDLGDPDQVQAYLPLRRPGDGISISALPPGYPGANPLGGAANLMLDSMPGGFGAIASLMQQLMGMLQQFLGGAQNVTPAALQTPEQLYNDATASSEGDPHLSFTGTENTGQVDNARFDSMADHASLIRSDSFEGGYNIATQVTAPNANGATLNKSATLTTNYGRTSVTLDNTGAASILKDGTPVAIATGQTLDLGNGQTVTRQNDGSLDIINSNGQGGTLHTIFKNNGGGVDVTTAAHNVDLAGDVLNKPAPVHPHHPHRRRLM